MEYQIEFMRYVKVAGAGTDCLCLTDSERERYFAVRELNRTNHNSTDARGEGLSKFDPFWAMPTHKSEDICQCLWCAA